MTEIVKAPAGGALAVRPEQTDWTPAQAAVLRQSGIKDEVSREELTGFLHLCQRTGLDPFSRQIYLIGRWDKRARREVYRPQTGIDGYRVVAHRAAREGGGSLGYEDPLWCDASGRWTDVWLSDEPPAAAKVVVIRDGQRFPAVARYREYVQTGQGGQPSGLWGKMPATMTAKCAESLALRMAFPHDLAGVYTAEEMGQADSTAPQLRAVSSGEPDPWQAAPPQPAAPARDFVTEAREAADADTVRGIYREAQAAGVDEQRLGHIASIGQSLAAGPPPPKPTESTEPTADAEPSPEEADARAAEAELRAWAAENGLDDVDRDAETALTMPLRMAPAEAVRGLLAQLRGDAA